MKNNRFFSLGTLVLALALIIGMVLTGCDDIDDSSGYNNSGNNSSGNNDSGNNNSGNNNSGNNSSGNNNSGNNSGNNSSNSGKEDKTPAKPSFVSGTGYVTRLYIYWYISPTPQNIVIEAWRPSSRSWTTIETLSGSETSYNFTGYNSYITGDNNGPQGLYDERKAVFVRVRGENGATLGPAKAIMFDTL